MDRISGLPDDVICRILSFLPTKHAVATSILCSRWLNLWSFVSVIDLDHTLYLNPPRRGEDNTELFIRFVERVLFMNQSQTILKFRLVIRYPPYRYRYDEKTLFKIDGFIRNVISRNVVEIELELYSLSPDDYCFNIPNSQSLKVLKVSSVGWRLKMPAFPGCFPSLRVFDVYVAPHEDDEWITKLFPCLPALEKLQLAVDLDERTGPFNFNIGGTALTHLELHIDNFGQCDDVMVVIDAPKIDYLSLRDGFMASYLVKHKPAISEVSLKLDVVHLTRFNELLRGLVNTKYLAVDATKLQVSGTHLPYLTKLKLHVTDRSWRLVLHWLRSCPNLKLLSVIISEYPTCEFEEAVPDVPSCLSSCIKEIEIKSRGEVDLENLCTYLLDNAKVLDNFKVNSRVYIKDGISQVV